MTPQQITFVFKLEDEDVEDAAAARNQDDAIPVNDTVDIAWKRLQPCCAGSRQSTQLLGLSWRQCPAAGQLLLDPWRQALKLVTGEASAQDVVVTFAKAVSLVAFRIPPAVAVIMIIVFILIIITMA